MFFYPVFVILIKEEKMRVFKQCAIYNLMHAIKQFKKIPLTLEFWAPLEIAK
jgi:hypothetical protein